MSVPSRHLEQSLPNGDGAGVRDRLQMLLEGGIPVGDEEPSRTYEILQHIRFFEQIAVRQGDPQAPLFQIWETAFVRLAVGQIRSTPERRRALIDCVNQLNLVANDNEQHTLCKTCWDLIRSMSREPSVAAMVNVDASQFLELILEDFRQESRKHVEAAKTAFEHAIQDKAVDEYPLGMGHLRYVERMAWILGYTNLNFYIRCLREDLDAVDLERLGESQAAREGLAKAIDACLLLLRHRIPFVLQATPSSSPLSGEEAATLQLRQALANLYAQNSSAPRRSVASAAELQLVAHAVHEFIIASLAELSFDFDELQYLASMMARIKCLARGAARVEVARQAAWLEEQIVLLWVMKIVPDSDWTLALHRSITDMVDSILGGSAPQSDEQCIPTVSTSALKPDPSLLLQQQRLVWEDYCHTDPKHRLVRNAMAFSEYQLERWVADLRGLVRARMQSSRDRVIELMERLELLLGSPILRRTGETEPRLSPMAAALFGRLASHGHNRPRRSSLSASSPAVLPELSIGSSLEYHSALRDLPRSALRTTRHEEESKPAEDSSAQQRWLDRLAETAAGMVARDFARRDPSRSTREQVAAGNEPSGVDGEKSNVADPFIRLWITSREGAEPICAVAFARTDRGLALQLQPKDARRLSQGAVVHLREDMETDPVPATVCQVAPCSRVSYMVNIEWNDSQPTRSP